MTNSSKKIVMTLDAGGTNFVFSAMQNNQQITESVCLPSNAHDLDLCIKTLFDGFDKIKACLKQAPEAISFAFPGPADYAKGIIGDLPNLKAFRGGVPLGPILENHYQIPVFINNDGWLYAYGEALAGYLPKLNEELQKNNSEKQFKNLIGITLGTGFGCGVVSNSQLFTGDNVGTEAWTLSNKFNPVCNAEEEGVAIRVVKRKYKEFSTENNNELTPKDIYEIAIGKKDGNQEAAKNAYSHFGKVLGDSLANLTALFDGIIVIGGGVAGAKSLIVPAMLEEMRSKWTTYSGEKFNRLTQKIYYLDDKDEFAQFAKGDTIELSIKGSDKKVLYDRAARIGIKFSDENTSTMIARGAYAYAVNQL